MALIIETGDGSNPDANSYVTVDQLRLYGKARGVNLNNKTDEELEVLLTKAIEYMQAQRNRYKGFKTHLGQPLEWPRAEVWGVEQNKEYDKPLPENEIPRLVEYAQMSLAIEAIDRDLMPNKDRDLRGPVIQEKVGDIEVKYSTDVPKQNFVSSLAKPAAQLAPLYKRNGLYGLSGPGMDRS